MSRVALLIGAGLLTATQAHAGEARYLQDIHFVSEHTPAMKMRVNDGLRYVGHIEFVLREIARVDRHHWVAADEDGRVQRLFILQFEGILDGVEGSYRFGIPGKDQIAGSNYRYSPEPVKLGDHEFVHNTWAYDNAANVRDNPEAEAARTGSFLKDRGFELAGELIMSRFARAVGEDRRNELIIFYLEPLSRHGHTISDFPDRGPVSAAFDALSAKVVERSLASFEIIDSAD